jgi:hypothetical protein
LKSITQYDTIPNYFKISHTHIFFDFTCDNLNYLNTLPRSAIKKVHVFVTNESLFTDKHTSKAIARLVENYGSSYTKVIIHIPEYIEQCVISLFESVKHGIYQYYVSSKDVKFSSKLYNEYSLNISYDNNEIQIELFNNKETSFYCYQLIINK